MPYEFNWEPLGVVAHFSGVVLDEELIAATKEVYASPLLPVMKYLIVDFSLTEKLAVSSEIVLSVANSDQRASKTNPDVKVAIITSSPLVRGLSNVYAATHEVKGGSWTTKIFECEENARAWAVPSS